MAESWYTGAPENDGTQLEPALRVKGTIDADSGSLGSLVINGVLTLGPLGRIEDNDGSVWSNDGIVLQAPGSAGDTIVWRRTGHVPVASLVVGISGTAMSARLEAAPDGTVGSGVASAQVLLAGDSATGGTATLAANNAAGVQAFAFVDSINQAITVAPGPSSIISTLADVNGDMKVYRRLSVGNQATRYIDDDASANLRIVGGGLTIANGLTVTAGGATITAGGLLVSAGGITVTSPGDVTARRFYPGNQATRYIDDDASANLRVVGGGLTVANGLTVSAGTTTLSGGAVIAGGLSPSGTGAGWVIGDSAGGLGFFGAGGTTKQTVTGSRGGNAALASLLTALAAHGLITNSSS